jgi:2-dehydropantoate 2-reductase
MEGSGYTPRAPYVERVLALLLEPGMPRQASMARDIARGNKVEADHVVGDMLERAARQQLPTTMLGLVHAHLMVHEARRLAGVLR